MEDIIKEISKKIYSTIGYGYKENIYHNAFSIELRKHGISFQSEVICPILYEGIQVGFERADIVIYDNENMTYVLEFKAQIGPVGNKEIIQVKKYLKNFNVSVGILINFSSKLEIKYITL